MKSIKIKVLGALTLAMLAMTGAAESSQGAQAQDDFDLMVVFDTNQNNRVEKDEFINYLGSLD